LGSPHRYRKLLPDHLEMEWFLDRLFTYAFARATAQPEALGLTVERV
jgi:hypothetical protein